MGNGCVIYSSTVAIDIYASDTENISTAMYSVDGNGHVAAAGAAKAQA